MIRRSNDLSPGARDRFDAILDVRSPAEFAADHVPGAINLPALSNDERATVGTIYVQRSRFEARRLGASLVAANIARHLEGALAGRDAGFRPLVYCWRGGMRSQAFAAVFDEIGWQTTLVDGGWRRWRRQVVAALYDGPLPGGRLLLLDGATGTGKTTLLEGLRAAGAQVLDLEALARHQGSLFGALPGGQPPQKRFESALFDALARLDPGKTVFAEAESSRIGACSLPSALWAAMEQAPRIRIEAAEDWRIAHILSRYGFIAADRAALAAAIGRLPGNHSRARRDAWQAWALAGELEPLVRALVREHYDPAYARSGRRRAGPLLGRVQVADGDGVAAILALARAVPAAGGRPAAGQ